MTEQEWQTCGDPEWMVRLLLGRDRAWQRMLGWWSGRQRPLHGTVSARKLRLFACACCRPLLDLLKDARSRRALTASERFADGELSEGEFRLARADAWRAVDALEPSALELAAPAFALSSATGQVWRWAGQAAAQTAASDAAEAAEATQSAVEHACIEWAHHGHDLQRMAAVAGAARRATLLRDIFGPLPFRTIAVEPHWLSPTVLSLAAPIYQERDRLSGFLDAERLAILGDALEDTGCADATMLEHLREPGPHVRGCWVVDLLLGKN